MRDSVKYFNTNFSKSAVGGGSTNDFSSKSGNKFALEDI